MPKAALLVLVLAGLAQAPSAPATRFAGVWVGTQGWAIANPPPGARADQPVTLTIEVNDGRISGTLKPFLGGEEGATLVNASVVGNELRATAVIGTPRPPGARRGTSWKDTVAVDLVLTVDGVSLKGKADVTMSEVPWLAFRYDLSRKRSRY